MTTALAQQPSLKLDTQCGAKTKKGKGPPCTRPAGWGTEHVGIGACKLHGGATPAARKNAAMRYAEALAIQYGGPIEIEPAEALLQELYRTSGHVAWLSEVVKDLEERELVGPVGLEGGGDNGGYSHPRHEPSVWIRLYQEERKHLIDVSKACISAGIEERRVRVAEAQGMLLAKVIQGVLKDLGVADDPKAPSIVRKHLTAIAGKAREKTA